MIEGSSQLVTSRGPKPKYKPEHCSIIIEAAASGAHIAGMMMKIGVNSRETWYRWQKEYPEFKEAVEYAQLVSQAFWEELGLRGIMGTIEGFNSSTYALMMNNKFSAEYKRGTHSGAQEINITNNTLNLTSEQLDEKIAQKTEKLRSLGIEIG